MYVNKMKFICGKIEMEIKLVVMSELLNENSDENV